MAGANPAAEAVLLLGRAEKLEETLVSTRATLAQHVDENLALHRRCVELEEMLAAAEKARDLNKKIGDGFSIALMAAEQKLAEAEREAKRWHETACNDRADFIAAEARCVELEQKLAAAEEQLEAFGESTMRLLSRAELAEQRLAEMERDCVTNAETADEYLREIEDLEKKLADLQSRAG